MFELTLTPEGGLRLAGQATIDHAAELRERLLASVDGLSPEAALDLSALEALDAAGAQLLLALRRRVPLRVAGLPPPIRAWLDETALAGPLLSPEAP